MSIDLAQLGFTKEELQERVIDACVLRVFETHGMDEDGDLIEKDSAFAQRLEKAVKKAIDDKVSEIAAQHVLPLTAKFIEDFTLQATNQWGEKIGKRISFTEYLVQRAEHYIREEVDSDGKSKEESSSSYWNKRTTRIAHMINKYLHHTIETAMKDAFGIVNGALASGIEPVVKQALADVQKGLKVAVQIKN
jgi:hypothetical protein